MWGFGQGAIYVASDSSAKFVRVGAGNANRANNVVPWSGLNPATGLASDESAGVQFWGCSLDGAGAMPYVMAFRPDNDYSEAFAKDRCK